MKARREQVDEELVVIKLFASNYARDLIFKNVTRKTYRNAMDQVGYAAKMTCNYISSPCKNVIKINI